MLELHGKVDEKTPYVLVALQECERMNTLTDEIRRSLKELDLGLKVIRDWYMVSISFGIPSTKLAILSYVERLQIFLFRQV